ncbi:MAG: DUF4349 domain-containing protein [Armatimonadota bacterium]
MTARARLSHGLGIAALVSIALLGGFSGCALQGAREDAATSVDRQMEYEAAEAPMEAGRTAGTDAGAAMDEAMSPSAPVGVTAAEAQSLSRKVIKTAEVDLEVEAIDAAQQQIIATVDRVNGFIESMTVNDYATSRQAEIIARVPSDHFREVYEGVRELGDVTRDHIGGQDVTQEYMDLERRISNLQAQEERVREMFDEAQTVEDLLKVEQRLTEVRGQIETLQGRLRYLKDQVGFSTLTITLYEPGEAPIEEPEGWKIGYHLRGAVSALIGAFRSLVYGVIWIVIAGAVVWIPLVIVIWMIRRWAMNRGSRRESDPEAEASRSED